MARPTTYQHSSNFEEYIQPENEKTTTAKPNIQKWGKGSVRVYGTINGPNRESCIEHNLQASPELLNPQANNQEAIEGQVFMVKITILLLLLICFVALYFSKE